VDAAAGEAVTVAGESTVGSEAAVDTAAGAGATAGVAVAVASAVAVSLVLFSLLILSISSSLLAELRGGCGTRGLKTGLGAGGGVSFFLGLFNSISLS
jgi:Zn-dependent protease